MLNTQSKAVLICLVLLLPTAGTVDRPGRFAEKVLDRDEFNAQPALSALRRQASTLFQTARYGDAAQAYRYGYREAMRLGARTFAVLLLNDTGAALLASFSYREAMRAFLDARELAERLGYREGEGLVALNLTSLYLQMGDFDGATEEAGRALEALGGGPRSRYRREALAQVAKLKAREGDLDAALPYFFSAIREADSEGDIAFKALVLNQLGYEYLNRGRLNEAERSMTEAFRLRVMLRDRGIGQSYRALGLLRMAQGDLKSAAALLERAVAAAESSPGRVPNWAVYHARGQLRMAQHRRAEAVQDFRTALRMAQTWRLEVVPAESVRFSAGVGLDQLYSSFIRAAGELFLETRQESLAREVFQAAEENRAAGLRAAAGRNANWYRRLPAEYAQTLGELRSARVELLRRQSRAQSERIRGLRHRLAEMEARAGDPVLVRDDADPPDLVQALSRTLGPSEALIAFHLDEPHSYTWVVTREGLGFQRLAGASGLRRLIAEFAQAVRDDAPIAGAFGERLYAELFGPVSGRLQSKTHWLLCIEDALFGLPFSALVVERRSGRPVFLAERHSLMVMPEARLLLSAGRLGASSGAGPGPFLGIGDAIYNGADRRGGRASTGGTSLQLPRLAGSAGEVVACALAWRPNDVPMLLEGATATRQALREAIAKGPSVIHFATHVVESADDPPRQLIQLSLLPGGDPDYVGAEEIATWRLPRPGIVVLSGCASGKPQNYEPVYSLVASPLASLPRREVSLAGLARAWLAAGASAVVVSLWPTPDDTGDLFLPFYRYLRESGGTDVAAALARAQVDMFESKTWSSVPRRWAAYSVVAGK